jgi:spermidine/putrescine transport system substrate-binding protein
LVLIICFLSFTIGSRLASGKQAKVNDKSQRALTLYNYEEYIGKDTIKNFQKETSIQVKKIYLEDDEEILGALVSTSVKANATINRIWSKLTIEHYSIIRVHK